MNRVSPCWFACAALVVISLSCLKTGRTEQPSVDPQPPVANSEKPASEAAIPVILASETDRLLELAGQTVTVEGTVTRTGTSKDGGITFLNFSSNRGGFVVVAFRANYDSFPDGFGVYQGKTIRVTGEIKPFQGSIPQMEIASPGQVVIVE